MSNDIIVQIIKTRRSREIGEFRVTFIKFLPAALAVVLLSGTAMASVSPQEAAKLKTTLTPFGAEKAGNATGEIPAWTGGMRTNPADAHSTYVPSFYAGEKPVLKIDSGNADKYAARLSPSLMYMLKNFTGFYMNIYPTHRDAAAPQAIYDNMYQNALHATMVDHRPADSFGGPAFPIPQTGEQVIWNKNWEWESYASQQGETTYIVPYDRAPILSSSFKVVFRFDGFIPTPPDDWNGLIYKSVLSYYAPPARAGEQLIAWDEGSHKGERRIWQYLVGQHRLRKAPNIAYDGTFPDCAGFAGTDELEVFSGDTDRYTMTLVGKKEMYVPYDNNDMSGERHGEVLGPRFLNPEHVRFELHRVWVVEFTLAPGARHTIPHRTLYSDEDTWSTVMADEYNAQGQLWRANLGFTYTQPAIPSIFTQSNWIGDLHGGGYCALDMIFTPDGDPGRIPTEPQPESAFEPDTIAAEAAR